MLKQYHVGNPVAVELNKITKKQITCLHQKSVIGSTKLSKR